MLVHLNIPIIKKVVISYFHFTMATLRGNEGRELLQECLLITEKYKGEDHPTSVTHLINLATSYSRSKNFVEAERLLRTSLRIMMKTMGPDDQSVTFPMLHLAVTLYHLKRDEEAEQLALEALRIREAAFGKESLPVGKLLSFLHDLFHMVLVLLELLCFISLIHQNPCGKADPHPLVLSFCSVLQGKLSTVWCPFRPE